jgi:hypothetical protein
MDWLVSPLMQHQRLVECLLDLAHGCVSYYLEVDGWTEFDRLFFIQVQVEDTS